MSTAQLSVHIRSFAPDDQGRWGWLLDQAVAADRVGVDRLVVSDHVVYGEQLDAYGNPALGGAEGGKQPTGPDGHWLEPMTLLSVIAGRTDRIRLGTSILLAALRRPVVLAKAAATLDVLSGGRLDIGVGVGWQREEYEAAGLHFDQRGRALDQTLAVCETLWTQPVAEFEDADLRFEKIHMQPKPVAPGGVPIWVSGTVNPPMIRRLARFGSGWIPWGADARDLLTAIPRVRDAVAATGRDPSSIGVVGSIPVVRAPDGSIDVERTLEPVPGLRGAGVTDFRAPLPFGESIEESLDRLTPFVDAFHALTGRAG